MFRKIAVILGVAVATGAASAQDGAELDPTRTYSAAHNQLGLLKFCQLEGFTGTEAIATQTRMLKMLPAAGPDAAAAAERKGMEGTVSVNGAELTLARAAALRNSTIAAQCREIESAVNEVADLLPAG